MKTMILTSVLVACLSIVNLSAQNTDKKVLTNVEQTESGSTKEAIYMNDESGEPEKKIISHYDKNNLLLDKIDYKWDSLEGWAPVQKYEYEYDAEGKNTGVTLVKWDSKKKKWADDKSKRTAHVYNHQGEMMAVK